MTGESGGSEERDRDRFDDEVGGDAGASPDEKSSGDADGDEGGKEKQRSIYDLEELDICPACGKSLGPEALVCVDCGYDLRANARRVTETREGAGSSLDEDSRAGSKAESDETKDGGEKKGGSKGWKWGGVKSWWGDGGSGEGGDDRGDGDDDDNVLAGSRGPFVEPGRGGAKAVAIGGVVVLVGAMTLSGATAGDVRAGTLIAIVLLSAYQIVLHTATGVGAVLVASRLAERPFGRIELAAARMFLAFGLFTLVRTVPIPVPWVGTGLAWLVGVGVYLLALRALFNKPWPGTLVIGIAHLLLWVLMGIGQLLTQVAASGTAAAAAASAAGASGG